MKQVERKRELRRKRHLRIRKKVLGTSDRPRLCVYRSLKHIYCQIIDDSFVDKTGSSSGQTLAACSTLSPSIKEKIAYGGNIKAAELVGTEIAKIALEKGVKAVRFDRGSYKYHGRIKMLAEAARKNGLQF